MQYNVSIHRCLVHELKKLGTVVETQEMLATDYLTYTIETDIPQDKFWDTWRELLDR